MSRLVSLAMAVVTTAVALILMAVEHELRPAWFVAREQPLALLWTARWADMFAQLLLLVAVVVALLHLLSEVGERWRSSTPTR
ncbi:MAG: hypothetical protein QXO64_02060 [Thermofilaceae archaeon]